MAPDSLADLYQNPLRHTRNAASYLYDMFRFFDSREVLGLGGRTTRWNVFEAPASVYQWKTQMDYAGNTSGYRNHGVDYLHAYWFARWLGVLAADE